MAEEQVGAECVGDIVEVGLEVGVDAGVEFDNFEFCLGALLAQPPFTGARPVIQRLPGDVLRLSYLDIDDRKPAQVEA